MKNDKDVINMANYIYNELLEALEDYKFELLLNNNNDFYFINIILGFWQRYRNLSFSMDNDTTEKNI